MIIIKQLLYTLKINKFLETNMTCIDLLYELYKIILIYLASLPVFSYSGL